MAETFRALSIRQPWAWAILHAGKRVENRGWPRCDYRGPILLHAGKGCTRDEYASAVASVDIMRADLGRRPAAVPPLAELTRGAIVGIARIVRADRHPEAGVVTVKGADQVVRKLEWSRGYLGFRIASGPDEPVLGLQLDDVRVLPPVPWKGALGFFYVPAGPLPAAYHDAWRELAGKAGAHAG